MDKVLKDLMLEIDLQAVLEAMESADGEEEILGHQQVSLQLNGSSSDPPSDPLLLT